MSTAIRSKKVLAGVDIGGSHIGIGLIDSALRVLCGETAQIQTKSLGGVTELIGILSENIKKLLSSGDRMELIGVGIGAPGQCVNGVLTSAANILPNERDIPLASLLSAALGGVHVVLLNDADAYLAAEVLSPRFKELHGDVTTAAMLTLGTGIGFSLYLNRSLYQGPHGLLEAGHMIVADKAEERCGCGQRGCAEMFSSAKSTARRFLQRIGDPEGVADAKLVFDRAAAGDQAARDVIEEAADYLAILCVNICRVVDAEVVIFGGGMSQAGESFLNLIMTHIHKRSWTILPTDVKLVLTSCQQDEAGIVGAALAAIQTAGDSVPTPSPSGIVMSQTMLVGLLAVTFLAGGIVSALGIKSFFGCTRHKH